jgi:hypothetical protein
MFEVIGILVVAIVGWAIIKMAIHRVNPEYGLKVAERRYMEDPSDVNERLLWEARSRVNK